MNDSETKAGAETEVRTKESTTQFRKTPTLHPWLAEQKDLQFSLGVLHKCQFQQHDLQRPEETNSNTELDSQI